MDRIDFSELTRLIEQQTNNVKVKAERRARTTTKSLDEAYCEIAEKRHKEVIASLRSIGIEITEDMSLEEVLDIISKEWRRRQNG